MAPPPIITNGNHAPRPRVVTVLVTGFGPFQDKYPVNPSYEIARSLPEHLTSSPAQPVQINVIGYGSPIRVCYADVYKLVPEIHEAYKGTIDLVLHIGMASGRKYYAIERFAHRDGYDKNKDLDEHRVPSDEGEKRFGDCPELMTTALDFDDTFRRWQSNVQEAPKAALPEGADVRMSEDAGHYLCDYIYYNSLAWFGRRSGKLEEGRSSDRPVLFLHVPPESDVETVMRGRVVATALIQAMVDCWSTDMLKDQL